MLSTNLKSLFMLLAGVCLQSVAQAPNLLSAREVEAGWQLMFDGKVLEGWHLFKKPNIPGNGWIIKDSSIYFRGNVAGSLLAPEQFTYRNFEFTIDWKVPDAGNSGIFLRYLETEASENIRTGPESQVCGKGHPDYKDGQSITSPGACYGMYAPKREWIKGSDEYNTFHFVIYEEKVAHFGNGIPLLEYQIGSEDWNAKYAISKYNSFPLYGDIHAGKLFLQDHGSPVWYRNIKIRPLTQDPWLTPGFVWPDQSLGIQVRDSKGRVNQNRKLPIGLYTRNKEWLLGGTSAPQETSISVFGIIPDIRNLQGRRTLMPQPGF